jgi:protein-S-isoprenylcysteine O-methyltransferase Ste14
LTRLNRARYSFGVAPISATLALWAIWLLSWLIAAAWSGRTRVRQTGVEQLQYGLWIWAGALLLFGGSRALGPLLGPIYPESRVFAWVAVAGVALGLGWTWWARLHLGSLWSGVVALKVDHKVVRTGPYQFTRHPIYTGLLFALLATALIRDSWSATVGWVLLLAGFVVKLRQEECLLSSALGAEYSKYQSDVAALVPGVW